MHVQSCAVQVVLDLLGEHVGCCSLIAEAHSWPGWVHWHLGQDFYMCYSLVVLHEARIPEVSPLVSYSFFTVCDNSIFISVVKIVRMYHRHC